MRSTFSLSLLALALILVRPARGASELESPEQRVGLLELFTSEGCSSCPPAEAWLGSLKDKPGLWTDFVPVAFHVDYWDSLGWPDRFASADYTRRQRAYGAEWGSATIYTPEFVLNGREWRRAGVPPGPGNEKAGRLRASVGDDGRVEVTFLPAGKFHEPLVVSVAPLGRNVRTEVRRGENAGKALQHDFVALGLVQAEMAETPGGRYSAVLVLPEKTAAPIAGLAAWVHTAKSQAPIQATGGWLERLNIPKPL